MQSKFHIIFLFFFVLFSCVDDNENFVIDKKNIKISLKDSGWDNQLLIGLVLLQKWIKLEFLLMKKVKFYTREEN